MPTLGLIDPRRFALLVNGQVRRLVRVEPGDVLILNVNSRLGIYADVVDGTHRLRAELVVQERYSYWCYLDQRSSGGSHQLLGLDLLAQAGLIAWPRAITFNEQGRVRSLVLEFVDMTATQSLLLARIRAA